MLRRTKQDTTGWKLAGVVLLASTLVCIGSCRKGPSSQLDLSVFQKEGVGEEQESKDRFECHRRAVQRTGFDPAVRPPDDTSQMRTQEKKEFEAHQSVERRKQQLKYNEALQKCMAERGYTIIDH
jgi:hypothetical protein